MEKESKNPHKNRKQEPAEPLEAVESSVPEEQFSDSQTETQKDLKQEQEVVADPDGAHRHLDTPAA